MPLHSSPTPWPHLQLLGDGGGREGQHSCLSCRATCPRKGPGSDAGGLHPCPRVLSVGRERAEKEARFSWDNEPRSKNFCSPSLNALTSVSAGCSDQAFLLLHLTKTAAGLPGMWGFDTENLLLITGRREIRTSACKTPLRSAVQGGAVTLLMPTETHVVC